MTNAGRTTNLGLDGRVALVTGGTRGLGLAIARKLANAGCQVAINYAHSESDAERAVKELEAAGSSCVAFRADVTQPEQVEAMLGELRDRFGRLDIFVHNAASGHPMTIAEPVVQHVHADLSAALVPLLTAAPLLPELMAGGSGRVVAVSNTGSRHVIPLHASLGVAKAALENLVRYVAADLAGRGIAVNAVTTAKLDKGPDTPNPKMVPILAARTPAGRLTRPEDVADVVGLLCTDEASWIHGQVICADGGLSLLAA